ncbi:unnamed protein product [Hermetia illucens]|uniref:Uncharacterized protein n=1 Tax=Hermetia illucens TaxID=343691 RepID=A0A7R8UHQ9_HERIL|nr:unnamed protein product [Hermetia illucens]
MRWRMKSDKMQLLQIADSDVFICFGAELTSFLMAGGAPSDFKTISAYWHKEFLLRSHGPRQLSDYGSFRCWPITLTLRSR